MDSADHNIRLLHLNRIMMNDEHLAGPKSRNSRTGYAINEQETEHDNHVARNTFADLVTLQELKSLRSKEYKREYWRCGMPSGLEIGG
jgi:hypothetical protein